MLLRVSAGEIAAGTQVRLEPGLTVTIGQGRENTICLEGAPGVERTHCVIKPVKQGGFGVKDLGTPGGTRLNGRPVKVARLHPGDRLQVGPVTLECLAGEEEDPTAPSPLPEPEGRAGGLAPREIDRERIGTEIGGYELLDYLGRGSMGTVYRATQISLQREVALKLMRRELTRSTSFVDKFVTEARAAARFNHPNVVHIYDVGRDGELYYLSMELMDAGSLEEELAGRKRLPLEEAIKAVAQAARGLGYAHQIGVVHRDIKPDNLMRNSHGVTKIADLGLAATAEEKEHEEDRKGREGRQVFGTPHFISPEQARGEDVDIRSDLYSLGCTFYRLVTGRTPFQGDTVKEIIRQQLTAQAEPAHKVSDQVPETVGRIIQKLMAKDPAERYQEPAELLADLEAAAARRRRLPLVAALVVLLLVAAVLVFGLGRKSGEGPVEPGGKGTRQTGNGEETRELKAENAYLQVRSRDLPEEEKLKLLEQVAREFAGTRAARRAAGEAAGLRDKIAARREAAAARAAREKEFLDALAAAVAAAKADGAALFASLDKLPHRTEMAAAEKTRVPLAEARRRAKRLLEEELGRRAGAATKAVGRKRLEAAATLDRFLTRITGDERIPQEVRKGLEGKWRARLESLEKRGRAEVAKGRAARRSKDREEWNRALYQGEQCALERIKRFDLEGALAAIAGLEKALDTQAFQEELTRLAHFYQAARRAGKALRRDLARTGGALEVAGGKWRLLSFQAPGQVVLERAGANGPVRKVIDLDRALARGEEPWIAALADPAWRNLEDQGELTDLAALSSLLGTAAVLTRARRWLDGIDPKDPSSGLTKEPPSFTSPLLELSTTALGRAGAEEGKGAVRRARREKEAVAILARALHLIALNRNLEAGRQLRRLIDDYRDSTVYGVMGRDDVILPEGPKGEGKR